MNKPAPRKRAYLTSGIAALFTNSSMMTKNRKQLALTIAALAGFSLAPQAIQAQTNRYWDPSGSGTFGSIGGNSGAGVNTWMPSANIIWTSSNTGVTSRLQNYTTTFTDICNFGGPVGNLGQGTGIIPVTTVNANSIVFNNISPTTTGTVTLQGGQITLTAATSITVNNNTANPGTTASHTITSVLAGGATSFTKLGPGNITLTGANLFTGPTTISAGRLTLGNSLALQNSAIDTTGSILGDATFGLKTTVPTLTLGGLNGTNDLALLFTTTAGGYDTVTALTLKPGASVTNTYSGAIANGAAGMTLTKIGLGTQVLGGANTFTGGTTLTSGTLTLDYSTQDNSKLSDTAPLVIGGGAILSLSGGTHTEVVGSTTINTGFSQINQTSGTAKIALGTITPAAGALVNFSASNIATTTNANVAGGILGTYATVSGTSWAANDGSGNIVAFTGYVDIAARGPSSTIANNALSNVRILSDGTSGNIALGAATTTINSLLQANPNFAATVDTAGKTLVTSNIMLGAGQEALNIGAAAGNGTLKTGSAGGVLALINYNVAKNITINAAVADNTSASSLTVLGGGTVNLAGPNTYTGPTTVYSGTLGVSGSLSGTSVTTTASGVVNQTGTGILAGSTSFTQSSFGTSVLAGTNTHTGATNVVSGVLNIQNSAALGSSSTGTTVSSGAALQLQGGINIATEGLTLNGSGINDDGALRSVSGTNTYAGPITLASNARINADADSLTISGSMNGTAGLTVGGAGNMTISSALGTNLSSFTKDGAGTLTLTGPYTLTGLTTISGGTVVVGASNIFTGTGTLSMPGTSTLDMNGHNVAFTGGSSGIATAVITDNSAGAGTTKLSLYSIPFSTNLNIKDGASKVVAVEFSSEGGSNVNGFRLSTATNTFSGGLTLLDNALTTRLVLGTILAGQYGTGPITIGQTATDRAAFLFNTATQTLANPIIVNTNAGDSEAAFRLDVAGITFSGKITANLADASFTGSAAAIGTATVTGQVTGPKGLSVVRNAGVTGGSTTVTLNNSSLVTPNDYAGNTTIQAPGNTSLVLQLGANDQIPNGVGKGNVVVNGTLNLNGFSDTINGLSGSGILDGGNGTSSITIGDNNATGNIFSGAIQNSGGSLAVTKIGTGVQTFSGANSFTGATTISAGTLVVRNSSSLGSSASVTVAPGAALIYDALADAPLSISGTLSIGGNIGVAIGGSMASAAINVSGDATMTNAAHVINLYGVNGIAHNIGLTTLISGLGGGSSLNPATLPTLGLLYNNTDFAINLTAGDGGNQPFTRTATDLQVTTVGVTPLTDAYWRGGQVTGALGTMAVSTGATSNWGSNAGGTATSLVPGPTANVFFSTTTGATQQANVVLGTNMAVNSLTFNDTTPVTIGADGNSITLLSSANGAASAISANQNATINAGVVLASNQTWTVASGKSLSVGGVVADGGSILSLTKEGSGTLTLSNANTFSGGTIINAGTLALGAATDTLSNTGLVTVDGATSILSIGANSDTVGAISLKNGASITGTSGTLTGSSYAVESGSVSAILGGTGVLTKTTAGIVTLSGASTFTGAINVNEGQLNMSNRGNTTMGTTTVSGIGAILELSGTSTFNLGGNSFFVGATAGNGTVNQTGGTVTFTGGNALLIGNGNSAATGIYNLSGGTISSYSSGTRGIMLGVNVGNTATFNLSGTGNINLSTAILMVGRTDSAVGSTTNLFNQTGGTATVNALTIGGTGAGTTNSTMSLSAGTFLANTFTKLALATSDVVTINISGTADVTLPEFPTARGAGATATINFNGGTLKPKAASATYMQGLTNAFINAGGAKFDTTNGDITIAQDLLTDLVSLNGGLTKLGSNILTLTGTNTYTGATTISSGTLQIGDGNTTGSIATTSGVTNNAALIYNRSDALGVGYAISGTGTVTKQGAGTTTFTGANTYAGGTTISAGTLQVGTGGTVGTGTVANNATFDVARTGLTTAAITGTGTTTVTTASASLTASSVRQAGLTIGAGNTVTVPLNGGDTGVSRVTNLSINATGKLDLKDNDLIVPSGTLTTAQVESLVNAGSFGTAAGITSSLPAVANAITGLGTGRISNTAWAGSGSYAGQAVSDTDTLVKYTYLGDTDLDGSVTFDDYLIWQDNFNTGHGWSAGHFQYDGGTTSFDDYLAWQTNFGLTLSGSNASSSSLGISAVPEPSTWVLGGLSLLGLLGGKLRSRRRNAG